MNIQFFLNFIHILTICGSEWTTLLQQKDELKKDTYEIRFCESVQSKKSEHFIANRIEFKTDDDDYILSMLTII